MTSLALAETRLKQFLALAKPRVVSLIVFCAVIGMFLAVPGLPNATVVFAATVGIALVAGAAAAINCLVEQKIDAKMQRTRARPLPAGELTSRQTLLFASIAWHLAHPPAARDDAAANLRRWRHTVDSRRVRCDAGIDGHRAA